MAGKQMHGLCLSSMLYLLLQFQADEPDIGIPPKSIPTPNQDTGQ